jgi:hypothetical protein
MHNDNGVVYAHTQKEGIPRQEKVHPGLLNGVIHRRKSH